MIASFGILTVSVATENDGCAVIENVNVPVDVAVIMPVTNLLPIKPVKYSVNNIPETNVVPLDLSRSE